MNRSVAFLWAGTVLVLVALSPWAPLVGDSLWACSFKSLTGLPCPTCGTTRAAIALARLDVLGALERYPLPAVCWILFIGGGVVAGAMALAGKTPPQIPSRLPVWARWTVAAVLLLNWVYSIATGV
jgi:Protein of unknown function (DUF2752)